MARVDIAATIEQVTFPDKVWQWLDLLGDAIHTSQVEASRHEDFLADTDYKKLVVRSIHRDLSTYMGIYLLLRAELIHQAAAQVRLACETLITLNFIARDPEKRVSQYLEYAKVQSYEFVQSMLASERTLVRNSHVERGERVLLSLARDYEVTKPKYVFRDRNQKQRQFRNWCNASLEEQARVCGGEFPRLYGVVYSQLSAYVHGSAWALRRQYAYSRAHYDAKVVVADMATVVRAALLVWLEWVRFCEGQLQWDFDGWPQRVANRVTTLDAITFPEEAV